MRRINVDHTERKREKQIAACLLEDHSAPRDIKGSIEKIVASDPTKNKKYAPWLLRAWIKGGIRYMEDLPRATQALIVFERFKRHFPENQRDINCIKTLVDLEHTVGPYVETLTTKEIKAEDKAKAYAESEIIYDGTEGKIVIPTTEFASCFWGRGTKWCTAYTEAENAFEEYFATGNIFILIHPDGTKWQLHLETKQYMDAEDKPLQIPDIKDNDLFQRWCSIARDYLESNPETAYAFAKDIVNGPIPELEELISECSMSSYLYAKNVIKGRWEKGEESIIRSDCGILRKYVEHVIKGPFPEGEHALAQDESDAYWYAGSVLKGSFPEGEETIATSSTHSLLYACYVIQDRFPLGEKFLCRTMIVGSLIRDFLRRLKKKTQRLRLSACETGQAFEMSNRQI